MVSSYLRLLICPCVLRLQSRANMLLLGCSDQREGDGSAHLGFFQLNAKLKTKETEGEWLCENEPRIRLQHQ
jgi:hypothetical protein